MPVIEAALMKISLGGTYEFSSQQINLLCSSVCLLNAYVFLSSVSKRWTNSRHVEVRHAMVKSKKHDEKHYIAKSQDCFNMTFKSVCLNLNHWVSIAMHHLS